MLAAGLSLLNVFVLGLVQRKRERAALRAIGVTSGQEQAVIVGNAGILGALVACLAVLGGVGLTYLWSLGSPVYYGIKIEWGVAGSAVGSRIRYRPDRRGVSGAAVATAGDRRSAANQLAVHLAVQSWNVVACPPKSVHVFPTRGARHGFEFLGRQ